MPTKEGQARKVAAQVADATIPLAMTSKPVPMYSSGPTMASGFVRQTSNGVVSDEDLRKAFLGAALQHSEPFNANQQAPHPLVHPHVQHTPVNVNAAAVGYESFPPNSVLLPPVPVEFNHYQNNSPQFKQLLPPPFYSQPPPLPRPPSNGLNPLEPVYAIAPNVHYQTPGVANPLPSLPHAMSLGANDWTPVTYSDVSASQSSQFQMQQMQMQMQMQMAMQAQAVSQTPNPQEMGFYSIRPSFSRENSLTQGFQTKDTMLQQFGGPLSYVNPTPTQGSMYLQYQENDAQYHHGLSRSSSLSSTPGLSRPNSLSNSGVPNLSRPNSLTSSPGSDSDLPSTASTPLTLASSHSVDSNSSDEHSPRHSDCESNGPVSARAHTRVKATTHAASCPTLNHGMCFNHGAVSHSRQGSKKVSSEKCAGHTVLHRFLAQQPGVKAEIQGRIARGLVDSFHLSCTFDGEDVCKNCWNALQYITIPVSKGGLGLPLVVYGVTVYFMDYGDAQKGSLRNRGTRRHMTYTSDVNGCKGVPLQGEAAMETMSGKAGGAKKRQRGAVADSTSRSHFHKLLLPCLPLCPGLAGQFAQAVSAKGAAIYFKLRDCTPTHKKKPNKRKILEYDLIAGGSNNLCRLCTHGQKRGMEEADRDDAETEHKAANEDDKRALFGKDFMKAIPLPQSVEFVRMPTSIYNAWEAARKAEGGVKIAVKYEEINEKDADDSPKPAKGHSTLRVRKRVKREHEADNESGFTASSSSSSSSAESSSSLSLPDCIPSLSRPNSLTASSVGYIGAISANSAASTSSDFMLGGVRSSLSLDSSLLLSEGESDGDGEFDVLAFGVDSGDHFNPFTSAAMLSSSAAPLTSTCAVDLMDASALKVAAMEEDALSSAAPPQKSVAEDSDGKGAAYVASASAAEEVKKEEKNVVAGHSVRLPITFHADDEVFVQLAVNAAGDVGIEDALQRMSLKEDNGQDALQVTVKIFVFRLVAKNVKEEDEEEEDKEEDAEEEEPEEDEEEEVENLVRTVKRLSQEGQEDALKTPPTPGRLYD